ncbi:hypothetical protein [Kamptonema sp. UHCC 0994]|uniref:hypothetical protein n=1 Tax=Kamptonema sp. UHCC 0994 TaxID=3031329 RepID=UPI0023BA0F6C|nr:hypothetical protein [Kamptonema sp. UHCC 0994]MDF0554898.1 hypothetical protein [Kamptonema sp. UHCC 0994]
MDTIFYQWYKIFPASAEEDYIGIDRIFFAGSNKKTVQYKTDFLSYKTGNAYIELLSRSDLLTPGWIYTAKAEWLIYFVYPKIIYCLSLKKMRDILSIWKSKYRTVKVKNTKYFGEGLIVPLQELRAIAKSVLEVK